MIIKTSLNSENVELAYAAWIGCNCHVLETSKKLRSYGLKVSVVSLYRWIERHGFKARKIEDDEKKRAISEISFESVIRDVLTLKDDIRAGAELNTVRASLKLIDTTIELLKLMEKTKIEAYLPLMRDYVEWLKVNDIEAVSVIERNLDVFSLHLTEKYG
jgi:hypothetical protein